MPGATCHVVGYPLVPLRAQSALHRAQVAHTVACAGATGGVLSYQGRTQWTVDPDFTGHRGSDQHQVSQHVASAFSCNPALSALERYRASLQLDSSTMVCLS